MKKVLSINNHKEHANANHSEISLIPEGCGYHQDDETQEYWRRIENCGEGNGKKSWKRFTKYL